MQGKVNWAQVKEILGWIISTQDGTLRLPPKNLVGLKILLAIPPLPTLHVNEKLERLIGKLCSMQFAIPGVFHLQMALTAAHHASWATA